MEKEAPVSVAPTITPSTMDSEKLKKICRAAEISHISFLLGAGTSSPFIPTLSDIEKKMDEAEEGGNTAEAIRLKRDFFTRVMLPCLRIKPYSHDRDKDTDANKDLARTYDNYRNLITETTRYLLSRKSTLLDKQANIFTTNVDTFLEKALEDTGAYYNDGFIGHLTPSFRTSHFQTIIKKKSENLDQQSEVPSFNLYKMHGSLTWADDSANKRIGYSDLSGIEELTPLDDTTFNSRYSRFLVINPNQKKFATSVLVATYYDLLRLYATELEKENTLLIVAGFSFNDEHILQVTRRAMDSNPTLTVCIMCHSNEETGLFSKKFEGVRYSNNLHIISPVGTGKIELGWVVDCLIAKLSHAGI
jgi:hypothetical protein